ncbi:hypothetical protein OPV22_009577 [Ensete ventricosum]|uniref:RING-type domain-containing protein n=1 Tax=Ensete ventricosum TaxID=4639 RepID=A0AAV8PZZ0_ENSVE|nr:hypothetical protein OPV22_009577 [Ensete ventricosum]RZR83883.1 hypothetical protein BHM03_00010626 [Ensete ventricosum]
MGSNGRDKSLRGGRRARRGAKHPLESAPPEAPSAPAAAPSFRVHPAASAADPDPGLAGSNPTPVPAPGGYDDAGWGYCTEEQLEEILLKNLDFVYKEALSRLVSLGYDEETALRAILCSGHCYGSMDVLSNILHNAIAHLKSPLPQSAAMREAAPQQDSSAVPGNGFTDLRHLQEYSLAGMVCLLQQVRPTLTRGGAMWCLLMSELHVGRASTIEIPPLPPSAATYPTPTLAPLGVPAAAPATAGGDAGEFTQTANLCKFHDAAATSAATAGISDVADPRCYDLLHSLKSTLRQNACTFPPGSGFRPFIKPSPQPETSDLATGQQQPKEVNAVAPADRVKNDSPDIGLVDSVLKALESMSLDDSGTEDPKKEMILDVIRQIRELESQVKERKEWAQQKALQAARKLSNDLTELRLLRMEREENQRLKKGKQALEDTTMKRLTEMENALKKVSGQVDRANAVVRRLETENAEIRAEIEASKLSASESSRTCTEVTRREKKCLKKLVAWEKQREKMQEEIAEEKKKIRLMQQELDEVKAATKEYQMKWKQEIKAKEEAIALAEEERRLKEAAKVNANRRHEALRRKREIDFQRLKDDVQRLEEELARLKASAGLNSLNAPSVNASRTADAADIKNLKEPNMKALTGLSKQQESSNKLNRSRACIICKKDEVSVVFLPCSHQVVCGSCNEVHEEEGKSSCPCCSVRIEERIRVYGASS